MKNTLVAILAVGLLAGPVIAQADYTYTTIDYPGATDTQLFGVNGQGNIVGTAFVGAVSISFVYNSRTAVFTVLPNFEDLNTAALGINDSGVVVGSVTNQAGYESGSILDKGAFTIFDHPGSQLLTEARGVNNKGLVSGWADTDGGSTFSGFIYDPKNASFVTFLPSSVNSISQGINNAGEVVGGVYYLANEAFLGSARGYYGFLRRKNGSITLFRVNGESTRARGITDSGVITGQVGNSGFVTKLASGSGYQSVTINAAKLLDVPGAITTFPEAITPSGDVVGIWIDVDFILHGFLATPIK
jgi:uncharacterized membrane protein